STGSRQRSRSTRPRRGRRGRPSLSRYLASRTPAPRRRRLWRRATAAEDRAAAPIGRVGTAGVSAAGLRRRKRRADAVGAQATRAGPVRRGRARAAAHRRTAGVDDIAAILL